MRTALPPIDHPHATRRARPIAPPRPLRRALLAAACFGVLAPTLSWVVPTLDRAAGADTIGATVDGRHAGSGYLPAGSTTTIQVTGRGGIPAGARAVALNITATGATAAGYLTVYPCHQPRPTASTLNYQPATTIANAILTPTAPNGTVCIYTHRSTHLLIDANGYQPATTDYRPLTPTRLTDTRPANPTVDGRHAGSGYLPAGSTTTIQVTGRGGIPAGARAVALNITATGATAAGYLTVYPCHQPRPTASTLNYQPATTIANAILTPTAPNGTVCIYTHRSTHLLIDANGYQPATTDYRPLTPTRLTDTRPADPVVRAEELSVLLVNQTRAAAGRAPVAVDPAMSASARAWSATLPSIGLQHSSTPYSENVAYWSAGSPDPLVAARRVHDLWVASPPHYANIVGASWTHMGIGLHYDGFTWWGTLVFR